MPFFSYIKSKYKRFDFYYFLLDMSRFKYRNFRSCDIYTKYVFHRLCKFASQSNKSRKQSLIKVVSIELYLLHCARVFVVVMKVFLCSVPAAHATCVVCSQPASLSASGCNSFCLFLNC